MEDFPKGTYWKFRPIDKFALSILIEQKAWFANPNSFNDPFDGNIGIECVLKKIRHEESDQKILSIVRRWMERVLSDINGYRVFSTNEVSSIEKHPIKDTVMWGHYGDKHKGLCFGFATEVFQNNPDLETSGKVEYSIEKYTAKLFEGLERAREYQEGTRGSEEDAFEQIRRLDQVLWVEAAHARLFTKAGNWEYENEYRFIAQGDPDCEKGRKLEFEVGQLLDIVFGLNCACEDVLLIKNLVNSEIWQHVKTWRVKRATDLFDVEIERV